ncbi:hydrolase, carbon-nitrogen family domain protein [Escherichia coli DEC13D]|nr:hydrolase, carbon-nitrogen family domain protein [Escherichia coli DEC13D]
MLGGADNPNGELLSYIIGADNYRGDSRVINPQGEIIATADAHQATRIDAELSMAVLREYRDKFPAWRDADEFRL